MIDWLALWNHVIACYHGDPIYSAHGPAHWRRVEHNGLVLARQTGADVEIVRLFALFHDSCRENEMTDLDHGLRGADLALQLSGPWSLEVSRLEELLYACQWHTDQDYSDDPTIGTCWDADRLDLGRVGIIPDSFFMSTEFGRQIAVEGSIQPFLPRE